MYPDLSYILHAIIGTQPDNIFSIVKTFGLFLVFAILSGAFIVAKELKRKEDVTIVLDKLNKLKPMWKFFMHPMFRALNWFGNDPGIQRGTYFDQN